MTIDTKEKVQYTTACVMLLSGAALVFLSFFMKGHIEEGTLFYAGQTMVYAASIFGVTMYVHSKMGEIENEIKDRYGNGGKPDTH